jgi:hypothetical protein
MYQARRQNVYTFYIVLTVHFRSHRHVCSFRERFLLVQLHI